MKVVVIGLGIQGKKRLAVAGADVAATVDPVVEQANYRTIEEVPLDRYQAALVCTPDRQKLPILDYLLSHGKHVLVEKPLVAERGEDLERLRVRAAGAGVACWTAYNHRFEPNLVRLRDVLASGTLGKVYHARFFYGNGTAADVRRSPWRDQGLGVIPDLGSHLLDLTDFLLGLRPQRLGGWVCNRFENRAYDHVVLGAGGVPTLHYEMSLLSWRNTFTVDVVAERGSAHVQGLCKWGPSSLTVRRRLFPSGRPTEEVHVVERPDPTWEAEYRDFKEFRVAGGTSLDKDLWINAVLHDLRAQRKDVAWAA
jgi:scyllo-inositol 2-dehydrogenase (NADP+)